MINKKTVLIIVMFIVTGFLVFSFANPSEDDEIKDNNVTNDDKIDNSKDDANKDENKKVNQTSNKNNDDNKYDSLDRDNILGNNDNNYTGTSINNPLSSGNVEENQTGDNNPSSGNQPGDNNPSGGNQTGDNNPSDGNQTGDNNLGSGNQPGDNNPSGGNQTGDNNPSGGSQPGDNNPSSGNQTGDNNPSGGNQTGDNNPSGGSQTGDNKPETNVDSLIGPSSFVADNNSNITPSINGNVVTYNGTINSSVVDDFGVYYINVIVRAPYKYSKEVLKNAMIVTPFGEKYTANVLEYDSAGYAYFTIPQGFINGVYSELNLTVNWGIGENQVYTLKSSINVVD